VRVIVAGSRRYWDYDELSAGIEMSGFEITEVVSGGARGADELGERWAKERGIPVTRFEADWDGLGKRAGHVRNGDMAAYAEALIAFPLPDAPGTADMIAQADGAGLPSYVHRTRHWCHANGCQADDCHLEVPFCGRHFKMLHSGHQKKLWAGRRLDGLCGACFPGEAPEARLRAAGDWWELFNLAIAILIILDYGDCGAPDEMYEPVGEHFTGFCWGCGVDNARETYARARKAAAVLSP
jgi:hypothetical protein